MSQNDESNKTIDIEVEDNQDTQEVQEPKKLTFIEKSVDLFSHAFDFMSVNVLFVVFNIPAMLVSFFYSLLFMPMILSLMEKSNFTDYIIKSGLIDGATAATANGIAQINQLYYVIILVFAMFFMGSGLICIGPFQAGFYQIFRNTYRKEKVSIFADFKQGMKGNAKQSLVAMLISLPIVALLLYGIGYYLHHFDKVGVGIATLLFILLMIFSVIQNLVYSMMVSIDLPLSKLYRNAFILMLVELFPVIGIILLEVVLLVLVPFILFFSVPSIGGAIAILLYLTFSFGFCQFLYGNLCGNMITKYVAKDKPVAPSVDDLDVSEDDSEEREDSEEASFDSDDATDNTKE